MSVAITGHLKNAHFVPIEGDLYAAGEMHGDARKRFEDGAEDGAEVTTSAIIGFDNEARTIITRNSAYTLAPWRALTRCTCCEKVVIDRGDADPHYADAVKRMLAGMALAALMLVTPGLRLWSEARRARRARK